MAELAQPAAPTEPIGHSAWARTCHWVVALSFLVLVYSGFVILMCHPRLYWGEVGNDLTPALFELPISRNHQHREQDGSWKANIRFDQDHVSESRYYEIFNKNNWARSLHFLAAWFLVVSGAVYLLAGIFTGHFWRHLRPTTGELTAGRIWREVIDHLLLRIPPATDGPQYGLLQKCAYCGVVFVALPLVVVSGLAMSPAITAGYPWLGSLFGGFQSARTIHFFTSVALVLFLLVHVVMVIRSGFTRQMRSMTIGKAP